MRIAIVLSTLLLMYLGAGAQNGRSSQRSTQRETVIITRPSSESTTIEINEDGVYVNGEQLASRSELNNRNLSKKIVIQNGRNNSGSRSYEEYYGTQQETGARRALLGVFTDARRSGDGAYIDRVTPAGAAASAGLKAGDIVLRVDTINIYSAEDLTRTIRRYRPDDRITILYNRGGRDRQTTAVLGAASEQADWGMPDRQGTADEFPLMPPMPPMPRDMPRYHERDMEDRKPKLGVTIGSDRAGVRITSVRAGSPAETAGLKTGDIITNIDGNRIVAPDDVVRIVNGTQASDRVRIEVSRNGNRLTRTVTLPGDTDQRDL